MVSGVIESVSTRAWNNKTLYSLKVAGKFYGFGTDAPPAQQGQTVQFESSVNNKGYLQGDIKTFKVVNETVQQAPQVGASWQKRGERNAEKDEYWTKKAERDLVNDHLRNVGAGRNTAIEFVKLLVQTDAVKLPAKQPDKAQALFELVEEYRVQFEKALESVAPKTGAVDEMPNPTPDSETEWQ